jgi:cellulose synthase/poly-beta-1,6-N-acetylglucosamine synthase-like glycosyltransferase
MIFTLISVIVFVGYAFLITAITIGWLRLKVFRKADILPQIKVSIIVAVRNESGNIETLINSLMAQDYPSHMLEVIIVDDHSSDSSSSLIEEFIAKKKESQNLKFIRLAEEDVSGKKAAINNGIQESEGELIVITDADCTSGSHWISTLSSYFDENQPEMILGPVCMIDNGSFFGKLQSVEFMSLISSAAGSCSAGFPILANGANIAFTRHAYESCGGFLGNLQYPSGDDMFLMTSIKKKFGAKAIHFLRSEEVIVYTPAILGFKPFLQQRLRWVSKSRGYTDPTLIITSILVFIINSLMVFTAFTSIINPGYFKLFFGLYLLKMIIDLPLMMNYSRFQRSSSLLILFPISEFLNAIYTLLIGIAGNVGKYEWKGRRVSNKGVERG